MLGAGEKDRYGIGDVVDLTGVAEATLRMWERRHGFPAPSRLPSGHRRYSERDVELVRQVVSERADGRSLSAAIDRVLEREDPRVPSVYARLRELRADLEPRTLKKPVITAMTHAIEDEALLRADRSVVFGLFQRERFYRHAARRWLEVTRRAEVAMAFADFPRLRHRDGIPIEVPIDGEHPMAREWALICDSDACAICITAWEPPDSSDLPDAERYFETVWSVEPDVVREAVRICATVASAHVPDQSELVLRRFGERPAIAAERQLQLSAAVTARTLSYLS